MVLTKQLRDSIATSSGATDSAKAIKTDSNGKIDGSLIGSLWSNNIVARPISSEGGQYVLAYPGNSSVAAEGASTWNIDVDSSNTFRIFRRNSGNVQLTPLQIAEAGTITLGGTIGNGSTWSITTAGLLSTTGDTINQNTATATSGRYFWQTSGLNRWAIGKDAAAESGSNVGADLRIWAYDDSGNFIRNNICFFRSSGNSQFGGMAITNGGALQTTGVGLGSVSGNTRGSGAVDLQVNRTAATQVASGNYSVAAGQNNTASGANSIALGQNSQATQTNSIALGFNAVAKRTGSLAFSGVSSFVAAGDAQLTEMILTGNTTNATPLTLTTPSRITINDTTTIGFEMVIVARRSVTNESAMFRVQGVADRNSGAASTRIIGSPTKTVVARDSAAWDVSVTADTANGAISITVTGEASKSIGWVASVRLTEITLA